MSRTILILSVLAAVGQGNGNNHHRKDKQFDNRAKEDFLEDSEVGGDAKDDFFRYVRAYDTGELANDHRHPGVSNLPKPGGFKLPYLERFRRNVADISEDIIDYYDTESVPPQRFARSALTSTDNVQIESTRVNIEDHLGKPLEIGIIDANINVTTEETAVEKKEDGSSPPSLIKGVPKGKAMVINDFIRFRRDVSTESDAAPSAAALTASSTVAVVDDRRDRSGKMLLSDNSHELSDSNREPRGATTAQWIKQPYPVRSTSDPDSYDASGGGGGGSDDSMAAPTETARAPRVHFVTQQRRSETLPPVLYRSAEPDMYTDRDRQSRNWESSRMPSSAYDDYHRRYYPTQSQSQHRYEPPAYYETRDRRHYQPSRYYEEDRNVPPPMNSYTGGSNKQRRIIYYTTLPEIVRTPPHVDMRDKYSGGGGDRRPYDGRYVTSPPLSVGGGSADYHHYRRPPHHQSAYGDPKARDPYVGADRDPERVGGGSVSSQQHQQHNHHQQQQQQQLASYPVKVSSGDVSVREIAKSPERRIYSDSDRRYKVPSYREDRDYALRQ